MTDNSLDREGNARQALAQIYRDYGRNGLDDGRLVGKLLPDLLGDAPREAALVRTAADNGVAQMLVERLSSGVPVESAARDVSILLSERNAFDRSACDWIVKEYALALGYPVPAAAPLVGLGDPTSIDTAVPRPPAGPTSHPGATPQGGYAPQPGPVASPGGYSPQPGYSPQVGYSPQASFPPQSAQGHPPRSAGGYPPQPTMPYPPQSPGGYAQPGGYAAGPYPYAQQPPPAKSKTGMIIAIVVAAVLVIGGGATAIALAAGSGASHKTGAACLIGDWRSTSVEFGGQPISTGNELLTYRSNGTGAGQLQGVEIKDSDSGDTFALTGAISFTYTATDTEINYSDTEGTFTATSLATGESSSDTPALSTDTYTCSGDVFTINDDSQVDHFVRR